MSSTANDAAGAPWADLPPDVCDQVLDRLDAVSVIRSPAVCTAWAAASKMTSRLRSGSPALITSGPELDADGCYDIEYNVEEGTFGLHDVATGKSYYGDAQGLKNRTWIGGKDDWLVTTDLKCRAELLNPITGDRVPLPSFTAIRGLQFEVKTDREYLSVAVNNGMYRFQQVALCQTPAHPNSFLAVALFCSYSLGLIAFTAAGDEGWTPLKNPEGVYPLKYTDVTVHNGKVIAVTATGDIYSWEMDGTGAEPTLLPGPEIHISHEFIDISHDLEFMRGYFLAASSSGQLQVFCMYGYGGGKDKRLQRIVWKDHWSFYALSATLHELDAAAGTWRRVRDLGGDRALFVGGSAYPFYVTIPPGGSGGLQADSVYVADMDCCHASIFDLKLGDDPHDHLFEGRLVYPVIDDPLQMPMWFRPNAHPIA